MTSSKLSALCDGTLEAGWLLAAVTTPLFISLYSSRSIEPDKLTVLRIIATSMAMVWLTGWIDRRRAHVKQDSSWRMPLLLPTLALIGVYLLSTFTSLAPRISWFGSYPRPEGTYAILSYMVIFMVMVQTLRTRAQFDRLITTLILSSVPVSLYGLVQRAGLDPLTWSKEVVSRVGATMGNPIFLGAYLITIMPVTLGRLTTIWQTQTDRRFVRRAALALYGLIAALQCAAIVLAGSRGPFIGVLAGLFLFSLLTTWLWRRRAWTLALLGAAILGAVVLIVVNVSGINSGGAADLARLTSLTINPGDTSMARLWYWENSSRLVFELEPLQYPDGSADPLHTLRPITGYGPDTLYFAFRQRAAPGLESIQTYDITIDRSHNETWDTLVQLGWAGWLAYQWLYIGVFVCSLRRLGLLTTRRERNIFIGMWVVFTALGGLAAVILVDVRYLGLALAAGNIAALSIFVVGQTLRLRSLSPLSPLSARDQLIAAALLGGMTAHLTEIQFGIALVTTRVAFWMFTALLVVIGSGRLDVPAAERVASSLPGKRLLTPTPLIQATLSTFRHAAMHGLITAAILCTLLFAFTTYTPGLSDAVQTVWQALTLNTTTNSMSYALLALLILTWIIALGLLLIELHSLPAVTTRRKSWKAISAFTMTSLGAPLIFALTLGGYLGRLAQSPTDPANVSAVLVRSAQLAHVIDLYFVGLLSLAVLIALSATALKATGSPWLYRRLSPVAAASLLGAGAIWINAADLNPIRADVYHKLGTEYEATGPGAAVATFRQAVTLSPNEDFYYMALGRALVAQATAVTSADTPPPSQFNDQSRLNEIMALNAEQLAVLNRMDLLYAAQAVLQHARSLNALYPDHTLNLARFYLPELPVNTEARSQLAALADGYYAQAIRLSPTNVAYWNEWADFDWRYKRDTTGAQQKIDQSLQINPQIAATSMLQGKLFASQGKRAEAAAAYQQAVTLSPELPEAYSALAFIRYQEGRLDEAIRAYRRYLTLSSDAPGVWEAHKNLAVIYKQSGDLVRAIAELKMAASVTSGETQTQLTDLLTQWQAQQTSLDHSPHPIHLQ